MVAQGLERSWIDVEPWRPDAGKGLVDLLVRFFPTGYDTRDLLARIGPAGTAVYVDEVSAERRWDMICAALNDSRRLGALLAVAGQRKSLFALHLQPWLSREGRWVTLPSDLTVEHRVLDDLALEERADADGREAIIGSRSTMLDVRFLGEGEFASRGVCRITPCFPEIGGGTGFRIGRSTLLTAWHVLHSASQERARSVTARFEMDQPRQSGAPGTAEPFGPALVDLSVEVRADVESVLGEARLDWAVIRTREALPDWVTTLDVSAAPAPRLTDRIGVVHYPRGGRKMVSLAHNLVVFVDEVFVEHLADTDEGSSGAPIFDITWTPVALHRGWVPAPRGEGRPYRNEGVRLDLIASRMKALGVDPTQ